MPLRKEPLEEERAEAPQTTGSDKWHRAVFIPDANLKPLDLKPGFRQYLTQLWQRRHFIKRYARAQSFSNGRNTFLGKLWVILDPLVQVAMYALIFGFILRTNRGIDNFLGFLIIGVIFFRVTSGSITAGSGLVQKNRALITSFHFPRATIAFSQTFKSFYDNLTPCILAVVLALLFQLESPLSWTFILVIPLYFLIHVFGAGATLISARITAFIPDFKQVISVCVRGLFFVSGIFFSIERFEHHEGLQTLMQLNPIYQFIHAVRTCVLDGQVPSSATWLYLTIWSIALLITGLVTFWSAEARYTHAK